MSWPDVRECGFDVDAAAELLKQIVPIPEAVELQSLANRHDAIDRAAVQAPNQGVQFLRCETKPRQGLVPAAKEGGQLQKTFEMRLEEQSATGMTPLETGQRVQTINPLYRRHSSTVELRMEEQAYTSFCMEAAAGRTYRRRSTHPATRRKKSAAAARVSGPVPHQTTRRGEEHANWSNQ